MENDGFAKLGDTEKRLHGPRGLVVAGYPLKERKIVMGMLGYLKINDVPVIFPSEQHLDLPLLDVLALPHRTGLEDESGLPRAVIMSGLTERELGQLMAMHRGAELAPPLWATLTVHSESWSLGRLLGELSAEAEAFRAMKKREETA
jgi:hypothetical protein